MHYRYEANQLNQIANQNASYIYDYEVRYGKTVRKVGIK